MNQTRTKPTGDGAKRRREYVVKKAIANMLATLGCSAAFGLGMLAAILAVPFLFLLILSINYGGIDIIFAAVYLVVLLILGGLALLGGRLYNTFEKQSRFMPYVPPVPDQIAALPAEEVLLRGSDPPSAAPDELLRAAHQGVVTPSDELLRPELSPSSDG